MGVRRRDGARVGVRPRDGGGVGMRPRDGARVGMRPRDGARVGVRPGDGARVGLGMAAYDTPKRRDGKMEKWNPPGAQNAPAAKSDKTRWVWSLFHIFVEEQGWVSGLGMEQGWPTRGGGWVPRVPLVLLDECVL